MRILFVKRALRQSIRTGLPADDHGLPVPWLPFPARDYLSQLDVSHAVVPES